MSTNGTGLRRAALYARVSTAGQSPDNQLVALRAFAAARGWQAQEFIDHGISGAKERRPALDALLASARARKVDLVLCVKLDRLARSVRHLVAMATEFQTLGVDLVALDQAIDTTTPAGRLLFHVLSAIAEFERDLIRDRVVAGLQRARMKGTRSGKAIGRPRLHHVSAAAVQALMAREGLSLRAAARRLAVPVQAAHRAVRNPVPQTLAKSAIV